MNYRVKMIGVVVAAAFAATCAEAQPQAASAPKAAPPSAEALAQQAQVQALLDPHVEEYLRAVTAAIPGATTVQTLRGRLANTGVQSFSVEADAGHYYITAVCDEACSNVDLRMLKADGSVSLVNEGADKFPVTEATVTGKTSFYVQVVMTACTKDPCAWGARILKK